MLSTADTTYTIAGKCVNSDKLIEEINLPKLMQVII
jgi:hypothetical protein